MVNNFKTGDILAASDRRLTAGYHYIIYLERLNKISFIGSMLTGSSMKKNVKLEAELFETHNKGGVKFTIPSKESYVVKAKLIKLSEWGPFAKVGQLTIEGTEFIQDLINDLDGETWEQYKHRTKSLKP